MQRLTTFNRTGVDSQAIVLVADAAHEALAEHGAAYVDEPRRRLLGIGEGDRRGRVEVELRDASLGDHRVAVERDRRVAVPFDLERAFERGRQAERHLDRVAVEERREAPDAYPRSPRSTVPGNGVER